MARLPREYRLENRDARRRLQVRDEPYWRQIVPGTFLGLRRGQRKSAWIVRQRQPGGGYAEQRIGTPDDHADADGEVVLSYAQAVRLATSTQLDARRHTPATPAPKHYGDGLTLNDVFDGYIADRAVMPGPRGRVMSPDNVAATRQAWNLHLRDGRDGIGKKLVTALDDDALRRWHAGILQKPPRWRGGKERPYDPSDPEHLRRRMAAANRVLTIVKAALSHARVAKVLPDSMPDYWLRVKPYALGDEPPPRMLTHSEVQRLLAATQGDTGLRNLVVAALITGARMGDLRRLSVSDFSPDSGTIRIAQGKTGKTLWQPLTGEGVAFFRRLCAGREPGEVILCKTSGGAWGKAQHSRPFRMAVEAAGLEDVSAKVLRATYGKLLLLATRDLELVSRALGHSDSRITRMHYAQLLPGEVARGIQQMPPLGIGGDDAVVAMR